MAEQGGSNLFSRGGQAESCVRAEELRGRGDTGRVFRKLIQCDQKIRKSQAVNLAVPIWRRCIESNLNRRLWRVKLGEISLNC